MYGLFEYSYDWYEWEDLICVSESYDKLKEVAIRKCEHRCLVESKEEHKQFAKVEKSHTFIREIDFI